MEAEPVMMMLPPKSCIPRNYSCIAALFGGLVPEQNLDDEMNTEGDETSSDSGGECEPGDVGIVDQKPRGREAFSKPPHSPGQRRRCKSLPTPAERAKLAIARTRSPGCQKKVRFADSLGLDLISVKHFDDADDEPEVPICIMDRFKKARALHLNNFDKCGASSRSVFLELLFTSPGLQQNFSERLHALAVLLESAHADEFSLSGTVRVLNLEFRKNVLVRYTLNRWKTFMDVQALYVPDSSDGLTDKFSFKIVAPDFLELGGTLQFAIKYSVGGREFWDNNNGSNYEVKRHRFKISPPKEWENGWIHFI